MSNVIEFRQQEPDMMIWACNHCDSEAFVLIHDGTVMCDVCETIHDELIWGSKDREGVPE